MEKDYSKDFQTPPAVAEYMATMLYSNVKPKYGRLILEPTPGEGNLVKALKDRGYDIYRPKDYFLRNKDYDDEFDAVVMNPPFNAKYAILDHAPENYGGDEVRLQNAHRVYGNGSYSHCFNAMVYDIRQRCKAKGS